MRYKSLIVYTSLTNNTHQVAQQLADTFQAYNVDVTMARLLPKYKGGDIAEYYPEDFDFLCLGSPIIAALPYLNFNSCVGNQEDYKQRNLMLHRRPMEERPLKNRYGIAFTTYGGTGNGPRECIATLEILKAYLRTYGHTPVGEFACCGKELRHNSVDMLGDKLKMNIPDAQALMSRYRDNPQDKEFQTLSPELLKTLEQLATDNPDESFGGTLFRDNDPLGIGKPGQSFWHYDMQIRPHDRDLMKAQYLLETILEDYLMTGDGAPRTPSAIYKSIS